MRNFLSGKTLAATGLVALALGTASAQAQVVNPYFQIRPGLSVSQHAFNIATVGRGLQQVPPYAFGRSPFNPFPGNPGILQPGFPSPLDPYGAYPGAFSSPYTSASLSGENQSSVGGYLRGAADVTNAQANFLKAIQEASLLRERVLEERLNNRRRVQEQYLWERANLPTPEQLRQERDRQEVLRSMTNPPSTEVWSAKALNDLLVELIRLQNRAVLTTKPGAAGPQFALNPDQLKLINVTAARGGAGNIGLLKNQGRVAWPLALTSDEQYRAERNRLEALAQDTWKQVGLGNPVDGGAIRTMEADVENLRRKLAANVVDLTPTQYMQAKRFLDNFDEAVKALAHPDAAQYVSRKYEAKGKSVAELVDHMNRDGLMFAPAVPGDEAAYTALHRLMAAYSLANQPQIAAEAKPEK